MPIAEEVSSIPFPAPPARGLRWIAALAAAVIAYAIGQDYFCAAPFTTDENSYEFQARAFLDGRLARPCPPDLPEAFDHEMLIMDEKAGWLSRYPPGHAVWLMPGVWLGDPRLMSALAAALCVWLVSGCAVRLGLPAWTALGLLLLSPYFLCMHGTVLGHSSGCLAAAALLWCHIRWRLRDRWGWALAAGLAWSVLFLNRTYTASLIAAPFAAEALIWLACHWRQSRAWLGTAAFGAAAAVGVGVYLLYNALAVGNPLTPTYLFYDETETLGFGWKNTANYPIWHDAQIGLRQLWEHVVQLDRWLLGFRGSLALALGLALCGWRGWRTLLWLAAALAVWLGYMFFFGVTVNNIGPYYYYEALPFLLLAAAAGLARVWHCAAVWPRARTILAALVCLAAAVNAFRFIRVEGEAIRAEQAVLGRVRAAVRGLPPRALVLLHDVPGLPLDTVGRLAFNPRGMESDPLMARGDTPAWDDLVRRRFGDRPVFHVFGDRIERVPPQTPLVPIVYHAVAVDMERYTGTNEMEGAESVRVARAGRDRGHWMVCGLRYILAPSRYIVRCELQLEACAPEHPITFDAVNARDDVLAACRLSGTLERQVHTLAFATTNWCRVEPRVHFDASGTAKVWWVTVEEQ